jgi:hypothetical protein
MADRRLRRAGRSANLVEARTRNTRRPRFGGPTVPVRFHCAEECFVCSSFFASCLCYTRGGVPCGMRGRQRQGLIVPYPKAPADDLDQAVASS